LHSFYCSRLLPLTMTTNSRMDTHFVFSTFLNARWCSYIFSYIAKAPFVVNISRQGDNYILFTKLVATLSSTSKSIFGYHDCHTSRAFIIVKQKLGASSERGRFNAKFIDTSSLERKMFYPGKFKTHDLAQPSSHLAFYPSSEATKHRSA